MAFLPKGDESHEKWSKRIKTESFKEINQKTRNWLGGNKSLVKMHEYSVDEYIAGRSMSLRLGLFNSGFAILAQAVEKSLKCYLLCNNLSIKQVRKYSHNIVTLYDKVNKLYKLDPTLKYQELCENLGKWYNSRYPDAKDPAYRWARNNVKEIDLFFILLEENMPVPSPADHLIYSGGDFGFNWPSIFVRLFTVTPGMQRQDLILENEALLKVSDSAFKKFKRARHSVFIPVRTIEEDIIYNHKMEELQKKYLA